jgi:hypothetical protein
MKIQHTKAEKGKLFEKTSHVESCCNWLRLKCSGLLQLSPPHFTPPRSREYAEAHLPFYLPLKITNRSSELVLYGEKPYTQ